MKKNRNRGSYQKLIRAFVTQIILISVATFIGVFVSAKIVEHVLIKRALENEAEHFWAQRRVNNESPLPNTFNLTGFLAPLAQRDSLPNALQILEPGHGRVKFDGDEPIAYVSDKNGQRLYLLFSESQVQNLALYFGVVPLSIVLLVLYFLSWLVYRQSRKAISPLVKLADAVSDLDINASQSEGLDLSKIRLLADSDAEILIDAIEQYSHRIKDFVTRERQFTRDASHELRTPLAIIKGSYDLLNNNDALPEHDKKALARIHRTIENMEALLDTLLMLSHEEHSALQKETIIVNDLLVEQLQQIQAISTKKNIETQIEQKALLEIQASEKVMVMLFGNLLRNAFNYTQHGKITVSINEDKTVRITDTGVGMKKGQLQEVFKPFYRANTVNEKGHGVGLSIVSRLCERFSWDISMQSIEGKGTAVTVSLPMAKLLGSKSIK